MDLGELAPTLDAGRRISDEVSSPTLTSMPAPQVSKMHAVTSAKKSAAPAVAPMPASQVRGPHAKLPSMAVHPSLLWRGKGAARIRVSDSACTPGSCWASFCPPTSLQHAWLRPKSVS